MAPSPLPNADPAELTRPAFGGLALAAYAVVVLFAALGVRGLNEPDEGRYASIGREMAASGDWTVPHLNGIPHVQKPPVLYWATALAFRLFGTNETSARLPSALSALGILALTFGIAHRLYGRDTGLAAVLVLVTSLQFFALARMLTPDPLLSLWCSAAVYALVRSGEARGQMWGWAFFVFLGLGFLTKGPMAFVVPLAAAVTWRVATRRSPEQRRLPWSRGGPLALGIGLSWHVLMVVREPSLWSYFLRYELVDRAATTVHGRSQPVWFYVPVLLGGFLPWTPLLVGLLTERVRAWSRGWRPGSAAWLLVGWTLPPLAVLSISGSKLLTYVLPLLPPIAIASAWWLRASPRRARPVLLLSAALMGLVGLATRLVVRWEATLDLGRFAPGFAIAAVGLLAASFARPARSSLRALTIASVATVIGWHWCLSKTDSLNDLLGVQPCVRPLAERVLEAPDFDRATLFVVGSRLHGFGFYTARRFMATRPESDIVLPLTEEQASRMLPTPAACDTVLASHAPAYGLIRQQAFARFFSTDRWTVMDTAGEILLVATRDAQIPRAR